MCYFLQFRHNSWTGFAEKYRFLQAEFAPAQAGKFQRKANFREFLQRLRH